MNQHVKYCNHHFFSRLLNFDNLICFDIMCSRNQVYIVIILCVATTGLCDSMNSAANDKQNTSSNFTPPSEAELKDGQLKGANTTVALATEHITGSNKVGEEGSPKYHEEWNTNEFTSSNQQVWHDSATESKQFPYESWNNNGQMPKEVLHSGRSMNELPMRHRLDQMEPPSPCLHGGTFVFRDGKYTCECGPDHSGVRCETHATVCSQPTQPGGSLPCVQQGKTCRPVPGGGYVCKSDVITSRNTRYHSMSNMVDCDGEMFCPEGWRCLNVNQSTNNFRCDPPRSDLENPSARARRSTDDSCSQDLCHHGAKCEKDKCICLINYSGKYCEKEVNHCMSNPCKEGVLCEPRLGGYNCLCPATHIGIRCDEPKRITFKQMTSPRFLYSIQQYTSMLFRYSFYATSIGDSASVTIDFGDGVTKCVKGGNFTYVDEPQNQRLKTIFPVLNFLNKNAQLVGFKHAYKTPGYYNVSVEATNAKHVVYTSVHTVRVDSPDHCTISTKLRNCVKSVGANITEYTKQDHILILSDTTVNCSHAKLGFAWSLHLLNNKFDRHTEGNKFHFGPEIATNEPHLNIHPYSLPFGVYAAQVNITMRKPRSDVIESALTWFRVKEMKIVARLVEGSLQQIRWNEAAIFNSSMSSNPNFPPNRQNNLFFTWTCSAIRPLREEYQYRSQVDVFCPPSRDIPLVTFGPILIIPPRSLLLYWEYVFAVNVMETRESPEFHNMTEAMVLIVVEVMPEMTPILTIKCVRNCENDEVNPWDTAVLEAVCSNCVPDTGGMEWVVKKVSDKASARRELYKEEIVLSHLYVGVTTSTLVLDEELLVGHDRVLVCVYMKRSDNGTHAVNSSGKAERFINIAAPPELGYCNIVPQQGYAMLTNFHIFCYNFRDKQPPLGYEAIQFTDYSQTDKNLLGTLVGYEVESEIHDLRLSAGLPDYDHLTLIRAIVFSKYLYTLCDFNVTVFPVLYYLKSPYQVLSYLTFVVEDEKSDLALTHDARNLFANVQMIKVTAESALDLLRSDYVRYIDDVELARILELIQDRLASFLNQQSILSLGGLKHFATSLDAVLKLPRYHTFSPANIIGGKLLVDIVKMLTYLKTNLVHFNKHDVEDLAPRLMSASSNLLRRPQYLNEAELPDRGDVENLEKFANFTDTVLEIIFSYGQHIIPYKANHEKSTLCESVPADVLFSVQKNSPKRFNKDGLFVAGLVGMMPIFSEERYIFDNGLSVYLLYIQQNPFWWHPNTREINYPLVQLHMYDANDKPVKVPTKVMLQNQEQYKQQTIHGQLAIHPYWTLNDFDIQVNRIQIPKGGKLIVQFMPIKGNLKIQVIVKKGSRPELIDFWKEANVVPQRVTRNDTPVSELYSVYVDDESTSDEEFFYVGVLPHMDTLHALIGEQFQRSSFPDMLSSGGVKYDADDKDQKDEETVFGPKVMKVREQTNNTLPFEYAAYSIQCIPLNTSSPDLSANNRCQVRPATTVNTVFCKCDDFEMVTASFRNVAADLHMAKSVQFYFPFLENPLTFYLIFFVLIVFFLLLLWALWLDHEEKLYREIIFLADNHPRHTHFYLVIVHTGRRLLAGTTSNVAIQLIGEAGNSQVHLLKSAHRPVLTRGTQDWFVLKTEAPLGNIVWINLWHDHLEASPHWYCSKVVVHDIKTSEVWFFFAEQWLTPLYGDSTMSCSVYNTVNAHVFEKRYRFGESFLQGIGEGFHVWLSPFYKTPGGSYTRCQRVVVAFTHLVIMLLVIIHLFAWPTQDEDLSENYRLWTNKNLYNGLCTALIAFPVHCCIAAVFMCVEPKPPWWYTPVYWRHYMTIDKPDKYPDKESLQMKKAEGDRYYTVAYTEGMTKTSDPPEKKSRIQPMIGRKTGQESFCLPHWFKYIALIVVTLFASISIFFIYFNGVEHSKGTGYCTLVTLLIAMIFSILVLETFKIILYAIYHCIISRKEISVEDRSDLALFLEDEYKVVPSMIPYRLDYLEHLRKEDMYRPIPQDRVGVLQRNAIREASVRGMITDICIVLLFIFLLLIAIYGITDPLGYLNVRNVKNMIRGWEGFGKIQLDKVTEREEFLNYINGTLIPNLFAEKHYNGRPLEGLAQTADFTNYLVGVPRLRQIRVQEKDCKEVVKTDQDWASRCKGNYWWLNEEMEDFEPQWKKVGKKDHHRVWRPPRGTVADPAAWLHEKWWTSATSWTSGVVTAYSGGGYVALLGRTRQSSWQALDYLRANRWFDHLTIALFVEFTLYNPNRNFVSTISILAENTAMGNYSIHTTVQLIKVKQVNDTMPFIIFALFSLLVIALIICIHRDGFRIKKLRRWTYFGNIWYALNIVLAIMGLIVAFCLLERTLLLSSSLEKLREPNVNKYVQFNILQYWDQFLLTVMACMLFIVILQTWHLLSVEYRCHLVMTVLQVATHSLWCYAFMFTIFVCAFMIAGHLLFVTTTYQFRHLLSSLVAMVGFPQHASLFTSITDSSHNTTLLEMNWGKCFFFAFFAMYFFIFRWGFVMILIEKFRRVSLVVVSQRWLEPVIGSFMQMNLGSVRHFGRRGFARSQTDSLVDEYVKASFRDSLARLRAMETIVEHTKKRRKVGGAYGREFIAWARQIAITAIVIDHIDGKMQYNRRRPQVQQDRVGQTIRNAFARERLATVVLMSYLKMNELQQTLDALNDAVDELLYDETF